ncbi:MAG TPA: type IV pilus twitching motility protein PilT [Thermoanaerobaculia bacterium]
MATLDNLFRGALSNQMQALVLAPGKLPRLRVDGGERDVTKAVLDGARIELLIRELAPTGAALAAGEPFEFDYQLDGALLRVAGLPGAAGWTVTVSVAPPAGASAPAAEGEDAETLPVVERSVTSVVELLELLLQRQGSDLHLSSDHRPRMRVHGDLEELRELRAPSSNELQQLLDTVTPVRNREQFAATNDTDFAYELPGRARFRVNLFRDQKGVGAVLRTIPSRIPTFEELGLPEAVRQLAFLSKGLVLVTGPTGSGKSTTLAAIVDLVNRSRSDHIITIEDPVEFVHPSKRCLVNQREVHQHTQSFKQALRAALREDPDVVLVGEMRDLETVSIAIETAETGHLVFGTLHTTTAASTIERLVDQFPGDRQEQIRMMLADSLKAVIAQTLLKKIGGGRVAAYEILIATPAVSNLVREGKTFQIASVMQIGRGIGMMQMNDALYELVDRKLVEPREAYLKAVDKEGLVQKLKAGNHELGFLAEIKSRP